MTTAACGPFTFSSEFDSGNVLKAEYVQPTRLSPVPSGSSFSSALHHRLHDHEINIWTRPDCFGTRFENGNRTWFYFSIKGGKPHGTVKLNVLNLNKQVKLFQQGMQPVYRILPEKPDWERVPDKLLINETGEHVCSISFKQRLPDNPNASTLYIAFTYPYTYHELCELLNRLDDRFLSRHPSSPHRLSPRSDLALSANGDQLYYHRECVCLSFEGRRVELVTLSSTYGMSNTREERLNNLFPCANELRPFKFPEKKVVFMSARVHPGETPSSFVLNGFLRFLLEPSDPRAVMLRRFFVFKFIPILNPDGVVRGHYRTDPRGVNLNRVYLNPSPLLHPPIYAARKLLLYYHYGKDCPDDYEYPVDESERPDLADVHLDDSRSSETLDGCNNNSGSIGRSSDSQSGSSGFSLPLVKSGSSDLSKDDAKKSYSFLLGDSNALCAGCGPFIDQDATDAVMSVEDLDPSASSNLLHETAQGHQCAFETCDEDSIFYENLSLKKSVSDSAGTPPKESSSKEASRRSGLRTTAGRQRKKSGLKDRKKKNAKSLPASLASSSQRLSDGSQTQSFFQVLQHDKSTEGSQRFKLRSKPTLKSVLSNQTSYKLSNPRFGPESGLFLYLDLHGHTTKRGIFMYGNHFSDAATQAECMLLPRLMAVNSPHFDFSACNFTERLMCMKDKRDGASREGSGRVACHRLTGLIRSYTLECNYNTGKLVNHVVSRPTSVGILEPVSSASYLPPKYTIAIFEAIGKALAESLLDLTGQNHWSRLGYTELRSLDGVRRSLVKRLKLSPEYTTSGEATGTVVKKPPTPGFESSALFSSGKVLKKPKAKMVPLSPGVPLGLRRENQNLPPDAKPSGSQFKKLPMAPSAECPTPSCSTAKDDGKMTPPKILLKKTMKKKSLPKLASKGKKKKLKSKKKKSEQSVEQLPSQK